MHVRMDRVHRLSWLTVVCGTRFLPSAAVLLGLAFFAYALASAHSLAAAVELVSLAAAFCLGCWLSLTQVRLLWIALLSLLALNLVLVPFPEATGVYWGFFGKPNFMGIAMAIGLAAGLGYRLWPLAPLCAVGVAVTYSRTAYLAAGAALFASLWRYSRFYAMLAFLLALLAIVAGTGTENKVDSILTRLGIWQDTLEHLTMWGSGWGSFFDAYWSWPVHRNIGTLRAAHVYNDYLEVIFSLGVGSVILWAFIIACLEGEDHPSLLIVVAFAAAALTHFPLSIYPCAHVFALALGQLHRSKEALDGSLQT